VIDAITPAVFRYVDRDDRKSDTESVA